MELGLHKELYLESPACYDVVKFEVFFDGLIRHLPVVSLASNGSVYLNAFFNKDKEHIRVALGILRLFVDKVNIKEMHSSNIRKAYVRLLNESGFFG
jgi:hypothetical protein